MKIAVGSRYIQKSLSDVSYKIKPLIPALSRLAVQLAMVGMSFLVSRIPVYEGNCLFGISFVVGSANSYSLSVLIGFILNAWFGGNLIENSTFLAAAGVAATVRIIVNSNAKKTKTNSFVPSLIACLVSVAITEISIVIFSETFSFRMLGLLVSKSAFISAFSYFYYIATNYINDRHFTKIGMQEGFCCSFAFATMLMALYPINISVVSLGRVVAFAFVVSSFYFLTTKFSIAVSVAAACAVVFSEHEFAFAALGLIAAGTISSFVKEKGRALYAIVFVCGAIMFSATSNSHFYSIAYITEVIVATLVFLLIPIKYKVIENSGIKLHRSAALAVESRLLSMSAAMKDICSILERNLTETAKNKEIEKLYNTAVDKVCRGCTLMSYCWVKCYNNSTEALNSITPILSASGEVTKDQVFSAFDNRCINCSELSEIISEQYLKYIETQRINRNAKLFRGLLKRQFHALSQMLSCSAKELRSMYEWDENDSARIYIYAERLRIPIDTASCVYDAAHHPTITIRLKKSIDDRLLKRFSAAISSAVGVTLSPPIIKKNANSVTLFYSEQPRYIVHTAVSQRAAYGEVCGDVYTVFADTKGIVHLVLADGMGTGELAAKDGTVCCAFMRRLMENGFPALRAAEIANSTMSMKEDSESACTLDSLSFDMYSGNMSLFKAGAAPTYLFGGGGVKKLSYPTLPVGIFSEVTGREFRHKLMHGDIIAMVSDGTIGNDGSFIEKILKERSGQKAEDICLAIKDHAVIRGGTPDDVTVIVAKIEQSKSS